MMHTVIYWLWRLFIRDWSPFERDGVVAMRRPTRTGWETRLPERGEIEGRQSADAR